MSGLFDKFDRSIQEAFEAFDREHPEVYARFRNLAADLLNKGHARYSADALLHVIRWHYALQGPRPEDFKINNNFSSRYARKLASEDERFAEFFETRVLKSA